MTSLDYQVLSRRIYSNFPVLGWLLRRWAAWQLAKDDGSGEAVAILAEVVTRSRDRAVREMALAVLNRLRTQDAINGFCRVWVETRHEDLTEILRSRRYVATERRLRVLSALKVGALDVVKRGGVEVLDFLLAALNDRDTQVATVAASCVSALENRVVIDELCRRWVENPNPQLELIIRKGNYAPDEVSSRALFYFLLGEWQKYEDLDFDHSLLAKAYQSANKGVQARCSEKAKIGGRIEWVKILTNSKRGFDVENMTDRDWETFIDILEVHPDKKELWKFFYNAPVIWSKRLLDKLSKAAFKGFNQDEKSTLSNLFDLVKNIKDEEFMAAFLYLFIREPEYKIIVNPTTLIEYSSPTISPNGKMLALSTGKKEIILLSLPDGNQIQTLTVPSHIDIDVSWLKGLIFSHDNRILISHAIGGSNIYLWSLQDGNDVKILSGHTGGVNSLVISNDGKMLLSGGYDGTVILWSLPSGTLIEVIPMSYSEYNGRITLIGNGSRHVRVQSLAISPDDQFLVVGTDGTDNIIILYDLLNRKYLKKIDPEMDYKEYFVMVDRFATVPFGIDHLLTNKNNNLLVSYGHMRRDYIGIAIFSLPNIKFERILIWQNSSKNFSTEKPVLCKSDVPSERTNGSTMKEDVTYTSIENCAISPNGQLLVSNITINSRNNNNNNIEDIITLFCSLPDGKLLKTIIGHRERFVISPNGQTLISVRSKFLSSTLEYTICLCNLSEVDTPLSKFTTQDISKIEEIRDSTMKPSVRNALEFTLSLIRLKQQFDIDIEDASSDVQFSEFDIEIDG
jgi:WD40 repeat protein